MDTGFREFLAHLDPRKDTEIAVAQMRALRERVPGAEGDGAVNSLRFVARGGLLATLANILVDQNYPGNGMHPGAALALGVALDFTQFNIRGVLAYLNREK